MVIFTSILLRSRIFCIKGLRESEVLFMVDYPTSFYLITVHINGSVFYIICIL